MLLDPIPRRPSNFHVDRSRVELPLLTILRYKLEPLRLLVAADAEVYNAIKQMLFEHLEPYMLDEYWVRCDRSNNRDPSKISIEASVRYNPGEQVVTYTITVNLPQP